MKHQTFPRALRGTVFATPRALANAEAQRSSIRAEQSPDQMMSQIRSSLDEMSGRIRTRLDGCEETISNLTASLSAIQQSVEVGNIGGGSVVPVEPEYSRTFNTYMRGGDGESFLKEANASGDRRMILASMSVGDNSAGGYLAPVEWDRKIHAAQRATSPMRRLAAVQSVSVGGYTTLWSDDQAGSGWVGETASRPQTTTPGISQLGFASGEIYANAAATQQLLDDSAVNAEQWLIGVITREFARQEDIAFISGNGTNKPRGLLTYVDGGASDDHHPGGNLTVVESALGVDALVDFSYGLASPYRQGSSWLMSSLTAAALSKLRDGDGNLIWRPSFIVGQPDTLLGRPVELDETMPGPAAGNIAVAFGNFQQGYQIVDRIGVRVLRDPFTNKPFVNFYCTKRTGGGVLDPGAIRLLKIPVA